AAPPCERGGDHDTSADLLAASAETERGAPGGVAGFGSGLGSGFGSGFGRFSCTGGGSCCVELTDSSVACGGRRSCSRCCGTRSRRSRRSARSRSRLRGLSTLCLVSL